MGRMTLRHIGVSKGEMTIPPDMEETPDEASINAAFKDTPKKAMDSIRAGLESSIEHVASIEALLDDKAPGLSPDFTPLRSQLQNGLNAVKQAAGETVSTPSQDAAAGAEDAPASATASGSGTGAINTTSDVIRAVDLILDYYERNEPSSPVPLILARAKRLVSADFMTIIQDMAASGEDEVRQISGLPSEEDY